MSEPDFGAISDFVLETEWAQLPATVRRRARITFLDIVACAAEGARTPVVRALVDAVPAGGTVSLIGTGRRASPGSAALVIAFAVAIGEFDEANFFTDQHPANHVAPVALCVGEHVGATVEDVLSAFVCGYEVAARYGAAVHLRPDVSAHGTHGLFGGVAAAARLLRLDHAATIRAMRLAGSAVSANTGSARSQGAEGYHAAFGFAAERAISICAMAAAGVDGASDADRRAFEGVLADRFVAERTAQGLGNEFFLSRNFFKAFPCCADIQPALHAVDAALGAATVPSDQVAEVTVRTISAGGDVRDPAPNSALLARFSGPWLVANRIVHGPISESTFSAERLADSRVSSLARRVHVQVDPDADRALPEQLRASVEIRRFDGSTVVGRYRQPSVTPDTHLERVVDRSVQALAHSGDAVARLLLDESAGTLPIARLAQTLTGVSHIRE